MRQLFFACVSVMVLQSGAHALPPIEAYGELPELRSVALAPDGKHVAYLTRQKGEEFFVVEDIAGNVIGGARTGDLKARDVWFPTNDHVVIIASETTSAYGFRGKWEHSGAVSFSISTKKMKTLMRGTDELFPAQTGLGRIVGRLKNSNKVFMPAFVGAATSEPEYSLLKVDLDSGRGVVVADGVHDTFDWFVDDAGIVLAREDWDDKGDYYRILARKDGKLQRIHEESKTDRPSFFVNGVTPDKSALIVASRPENSEFMKLFRFSFDGALSEPIFSPDGKEPEGLLQDINRTLFGVRYSGMLPSYEFFDPALTRAVEAAASLNPDSATRLTSWTDDFSKLVFFVEGGSRAPAYYLFDRAANKMSRIASSYARIKDADIGPVTSIEYKARDGRKIPSIVTRPPGAELGQTLPLIVMPHGGPEAYDAVGFDWMAQYFANRGYLVLQPNFRGSDGFGADHRLAGHGEWGGKMQDDITDGVNLLVKHKWADPDRVCIIGGSYGGYAALAGGAYTPDLYKCVAAIAPVTDLPMMLSQEKRESGAESGVFEYWTTLIGDRRKDKARIEAISPVNAAENFKAPVLLIHGVDDTVVPYAHSAKMEAALKRAGKKVKLVKLQNEDHWLSVSQTRLQTLIELDRFVSETIGTPSQTAP